MLAAFGTVSQWATIIYEVVIFIFGIILIVFTFTFFRGRTSPFDFARNAPAYAYSLAFFLVSVMYFLAEAIDMLLTGTFSASSGTTEKWLPEVLPHFFSLSAIPNVLPSLGTVGVWLQEYGLELALVGPGEELFKTASIFGILTVILWRRQAKSGKQETLGFGIVLAIVTFVNGLWVLMHGILEYHALSDFVIAFVDGEILILPTWLFGNPFPAVIAHATWNALGTLNALTTDAMFAMGLVFGILTIYLWAVDRRSKDT